MQWLALIPLCLFTLAFYCFRNSLSPSIFTGLFWIIYLIPSLAVVDKLEPLGIWVLVLLITCIQVGSFVAETVTPRAKTPQINFPFGKRIFWFTLLALAAIAYLVSKTISENGLDYSPLSLLEVGGIWTMNRYARIYEPWPYRVLIVWFHPACLFGGFLFASAVTRRKKLLALASLLPPLCCTVATGARAAFLLGLACFLGSYWATLNMRGISKLIDFRRLVWIAVTASLLLGMFFAVDAIRGTQTGSKEMQAIFDWDHINDYVFGSPAAFSKWCINDSHPITLGSLTFPSVFESLGVKSRYMGTYDKEVVVISGYYTNVYTAFRGLIQDFTFVGAIIICLIFGYWAGSSYQRRSIWLSLFYAAILFSPLISILSFNGTILAWLLLGFWKWQPPMLPWPTLKQLAIGAPLDRNQVASGALADHDIKGAS